MDKNGMDFKEINIERIKALFPECVTDGKIDFDKLKMLLGEEVDSSNEKYSFNWIGKNASIKNAITPSTATLIPCKEKSKNWDTTENLYIEGDNLEVLKTLSKTYHGLIKMIYIDPPYNTGDDFVYKDDYHDNIKNYLENSGQAYKTNPETAGRFHTDWLNMLYPRLKIAKELLSEEGAIFVSIDDNEQANLKKILDEIFDEYNKVAEFIVIRAEGGGMAKQVIKGHDYLFVYAKNISKFTPIGKPKDIRGKIVEINGEQCWIQEDWLRKEFGKYGNCHYEEILQYKGQAKLDEINRGIENGEYILVPKSNGMNIVGKIRRIQDDASKFYSILKHLSANGIKDLQPLGLEECFSYPKPVSLLKELIAGMTIFTKNNGDIILDFFSGSATTADAIMQLNKEDGGNRKFIMVQLPEDLDYSLEHATKAAQKETLKKAIAFCDSKGVDHKLTEIGEERIRRAGDALIDDVGFLDGDITLQSLFDDFSKDELISDQLDVGFKVFKLDSTCIKPWDPTVKYDESNIFELMDVIKEGRSNLDVAYEIMLKYGVFNMPLEEKVVNGKTIYSVGGGYMIISLNDEITSDDVKAIAELKPKAVVFKESGFKDDSAKMNADYTFKRLGIDNVKCI